MQCFDVSLYELMDDGLQKNHDSKITDYIGRIVSYTYVTPERDLNEEHHKRREYLPDCGSRELKFSFNIDRPEVLQLDEFGGLTFSVNVGDLKSEAPRPSLDGGPENRWKIDFVTLDVFGKTPSQ